MFPTVCENKQDENTLALTPLPSRALFVNVVAKYFIYRCSGV